MPVSGAKTPSLSALAPKPACETESPPAANPAQGTRAGFPGSAANASPDTGSDSAAVSDRPPAPSQASKPPRAANHQENNSAGSWAWKLGEFGLNLHVKRRGPWRDGCSFWQTS